MPNLAQVPTLTSALYMIAVNDYGNIGKLPLTGLDYASIAHEHNTLNKLSQGRCYCNIHYIDASPYTYTLVAPLYTCNPTALVMSPTSVYIYAQLYNSAYNPATSYRLQPSATTYNDYTGITITPETRINDQLLTVTMGVAMLTELPTYYLTAILW